MDKKELPDIAMLSNEITYRRYLMDKEKIRDFFKEISVAEYIALHNIATESEVSSIYEGKTYLKELSEKMELSMRQTSNMIGKLRDKGLVIWSDDGNGSDGTYVVITDTGRKKMEEQENILKKYYGHVIEKYGKEKMIQLLQLMKELETIMSSEIEKMEVDASERDNGICGKAGNDLPKE
mgnify:CR=1 FL=1